MQRNGMETTTGGSNPHYQHPHGNGLSTNQSIPPLDVASAERHQSTYPPVGLPNHSPTRGGLSAVGAGGGIGYSHDQHTTTHHTTGLGSRLGDASVSALPHPPSGIPPSYDQRTDMHSRSPNGPGTLPPLTHITSHSRMGGADRSSSTHPSLSRRLAALDTSEAQPLSLNEQIRRSLQGMDAHSRHQPSLSPMAHRQPHHHNHQSMLGAERTHVSLHESAIPGSTATAVNATTTTTTTAPVRPPRALLRADAELQRRVRALRDDTMVGSQYTAPSAATDDGPPGLNQGRAGARGLSSMIDPSDLMAGTGVGSAAGNGIPSRHTSYGNVGGFRTNAGARLHHSSPASSEPAFVESKTTGDFIKVYKLDQLGGVMGQNDAKRAEGSADDLLRGSTDSVALLDCVDQWQRHISKLVVFSVLMCFAACLMQVTMIYNRADQGHFIHVYSYIADSYRQFLFFLLSFAVPAALWRAYLDRLDERTWAQRHWLLVTFQLSSCIAVTVAWVLSMAAAPTDDRLHYLWHRQFAWYTGGISSSFSDKLNVWFDLCYARFIFMTWAALYYGWLYAHRAEADWVPSVVFPARRDLEMRRRKAHLQRLIAKQKGAVEMHQFVRPGNHAEATVSGSKGELLPGTVVSS